MANSLDKELARLQGLQSQKPTQKEMLQSLGSQKGTQRLQNAPKLPGVSGISASQSKPNKKLPAYSGRLSGHGMNLTTEQYQQAQDEMYSTPSQKRAAARTAAIGANISGSLASFGETYSQNVTNRLANMKKMDTIAPARDSLAALKKQKNDFLNKARIMGKEQAERAMGIKLSDLESNISTAQKQFDSVVTNTPVDPNSYGQKRLEYAAQKQQEAKQGLGPIGGFISDTTVSVGSSLPGMAISVAGAPEIGLTMLGAQAAGQKSHELNKQGVSPRESLQRGIVSGVIEAGTEAVPIGKLAALARGAGGKKFIIGILEQAGTEATEESIAYTANFLADAAAKDPNAKFSLAELGQNAAMGFVSGGFLGTTASVGNRVATGNLPKLPNMKKNATQAAQVSQETQTATDAQESQYVQVALPSPVMQVSPNGEVSYLEGRAEQEPLNVLRYPEITHEDILRNGDEFTTNTIAPENIDYVNQIISSANEHGVSPMQYIDEISSPIYAQVDEAIKSLTADLKAYKPKGVTINQETGVRMSENEPWYSEFYKQNKRAPRKKDVEQIAKDLVMRDIRRGGGEYVPPDVANVYQIAESFRSEIGKIGEGALSVEDSEGGTVVNRGRIRSEVVPNYSPVGSVQRFGSVEQFQQSAQQAQTAPQATFNAQTQAGTKVRQNATQEPIPPASPKELDRNVVNRAYEIARAFNVNLEFADNLGENVNGKYENGTIYISKDTDSPTIAVLTHELTHHIERTGQYNALSSLVEDYMGENFKRLSDAIKAEYAKQGVQLDDVGAAKETVAVFLENKGLFMDEAFIKRLNQQNRGLFRSILDWISEKLRLFGAGKERNFLAKAQKIYEKAMREGVYSQDRSNEHFSVRMDEDGKPFVVIDDDILSGVPKTEWASVVKSAIKTKFSSGIDMGGFVVGVNKQVGQEYLYSEYTKRLRSNSPAKYADKLRAANNLDEIAQNASGVKNETPKHSRKDDIQSFNRGEIQIRVGPNDYTADVVTAVHSNNKETLYDIVNVVSTKIKEATPSVAPSKAQVTQMGATSNDNVAQEQTTVNNKYAPKKQVDTQFSLRAPIEETADLIALHNLSEEKLQKALELGGFPMPSIAITKPDIKHENFGAISLVFGKSTISPTDRRNKIYSADAWTPTFPGIEFEVNGKVSSKAFKELYALAGKVDSIYSSMMRSFENNLDSMLNREGSFDRLISRLAKEEGFKAAYLAQHGDTNGIPTKESLLSRKYNNDEVVRFSKDFPLDLQTAADMSADELEQYVLFVEQMHEDYLSTKNVPAEAAKKLSSGMSWNDVSEFVHAALKYKEYGITSETDLPAAREWLSSKVDQEALESWLADKLDGIIKSTGIDKGVERFTPSGNRKSFAATHFAVTLENIIKAMQKSAKDNDVEFYGTNTMRAAMSKTFKDIEAVKKESGKLKQLSDEEVNATKEAFNTRIFNIIERIKSTSPSTRNSFMETDYIGSAIQRGISKKVTPANISKEVASVGYEVPNDVMKDLMSLLSDIADAPVNLFEAKPERVVDFSEVVAAVVPDDMSPKVKEALSRKVKNVMEYSKGNEDERLKLINSANAQFSMKNNSEFMEKMLKEYGAFPKGENPFREIQVPKGTDNGKTRRFTRTMMEAEAIPEEYMDAFSEEIRKGTFSYSAMSDSNAIKNATNTIRNNGFNGALSKWQRISSGDIVADKNDIALGEMLLNQAANAKDVDTAMKLAAELAAEATRAGQNVQAFRLLKKMTPDGQLYYLQKTVQKLNADIESKNASDKKLPGVNVGKLPGMKGRGTSKEEAKQVEIDKELAKKLLESKNQEEIEAAVAEIMDDIAAQVPANWLDKWNAWRYLAMLGNPRTHIRNFLGNAVFMPAIAAKNVIGVQLEKTLPQNQRTKAALTKSDRDLIDFAKDDFDKNIDAIRAGGKYNPMSEIDEKRKIFNTRPLEALRKGNGNLMDKTDALFMRYHYSHSMAQAIKAKGYSLQSITSGTKAANDALAEIKGIATKEAQKATYRDASSLASALNRMTRTNAVTEIILGGMFPFTKTPINILKRGIEYSPVGLAQGIGMQLYSVKEGKATASEALDRIASGLTGSGIVAVGVFLAASGILISGSPEDKKEALFDKMMGLQNYSLKIGNGTYTVDWLAPSSMPMFIGAEIVSSVRGQNVGISAATILDSMTQIAEPMVSLSMLKGINNAIKAASYGEAPLTAILTETVSGYFGQAFPTLGGQVARILDDTRRTNYVDKTSGVPQFMQKFAQKQQGKLPGVESKLPAYIDLWGRKQGTGSFAARVFQNFVSPGYSAKINETKVDKVLRELYEKTGDSELLPGAAKKYVQFDDTTKQLTADEYVKYAEAKGQASYQYLDTLVNSPAFSNAPEQTKKDTIKALYEYADAKAKTQVSNYKLNDSLAKTQAAEKQGVSPAYYYLGYMAQRDIESDKDENGESIDGTAKPKKRAAINKALSGVDFMKRDVIIQSVGAGLTKKQETAWGRQEVRSSIGSKETYYKVADIISKIQPEDDEYGNPVSGSKKENTLSTLQSELGFSKEKATSVYQSMVTNKYSLSDMTSSEQEAFSKVSGSISEEEFIGITNNLRAVKGFKNAKGKTVSGSLKKNRYSSLVKSGMSSSQAKAFLSARYGYKW